MDPMGMCLPKSLHSEQRFEHVLTLKLQRWRLKSMKIAGGCKTSFMFGDGTWTWERIWSSCIWFIRFTNQLYIYIIYSYSHTVIHLNFILQYIVDVSHIRLYLKYMYETLYIFGCLTTLLDSMFLFDMYVWTWLMCTLSQRSVVQENYSTQAVIPQPLETFRYT